MNRMFVGLGVLFLTIAAYVVGVRVGGQGFGMALYQSQGELAYGHWERYELINSYIANECFAEAKKQAEFSIAEQKALLWELVNTFNSKAVEEYIASRNGGLLNELQSFKPNWDEQAVIADCS